MRKHLASFLRISITAVGLLLAMWQIDFNQIYELLTQTRWIWVLAGFMLVNISMFVRAYRWQVLLEGLGISGIKFSRLTELYFVGNFFNAFLPSGFGGDVVRAVEVAQDAPADVATGTVFLDRFTGMLVLFAMGLVALPLRPDTFPNEQALLIAIICVGGLIGGIIFLDGRLIRLIAKSPLGKLLPDAVNPIGDGPVARFLAAVQGCGWRAIWKAIGISILFDGLLVGWWTAATYALNVPVSFAYNLLVVPIMGIVLLVPSIGGLGVRELIAFPLYAGAGLNETQAVSVSLLVFVMLRLSSLLGAPVYMYSILRKRRAKKLARQSGKATHV